MNDQDYGWGDDPGTAIEKAAGSWLAPVIEDKVIAGYLLSLRKMLEEDTELRDKVAKSIPACGAKPDLITATFNLVKPGTERLLDKAIDVLLEELDEQRKKAPSIYLVSHETGRSIMPISKEGVYTPPDFVGLDGNVHQAKPVVHPGISSSLALAAHEVAKTKSILALAGGDSSMAFAHLSEPEQMIGRAKTILQGRVSFEGASGPPQEIAFGREHEAGMEQAVNLSFHRVEMFSAILAKKILDKCGEGGRCSGGTIKLCKGSKYRWFIFTACFERSDASRLNEQVG